MFKPLLQDIARNNNTRVEEIKNEATNTLTFFFPKYSDTLLNELNEAIKNHESLNGNIKMNLDSRSDLNYISVECNSIF